MTHKMPLYFQLAGQPRQNSCVCVCVLFSFSKLFITPSIQEKKKLNILKYIYTNIISLVTPSSLLLVLIIILIKLMSKFEKAGQLNSPTRFNKKKLFVSNPPSTKFSQIYLKISVMSSILNLKIDSISIFMESFA